MKSEPKLNVLVEIRPAFDGYAGIPYCRVYHTNCTMIRDALEPASALANGGAQTG